MAHPTTRAEDSALDASNTQQHDLQTRTTTPCGHAFTDRHPSYAHGHLIANQRPRNCRHDQISTHN
jgi:hypothetical protein